MIAYAVRPYHWKDEFPKVNTVSKGPSAVARCSSYDPKLALVTLDHEHDPDGWLAPTQASQPSGRLQPLCPANVS